MNKELLINIESAIHSQVIELGKCDDKFMCFREYELEMDGEVYIADFFITTFKGDESEPNKYEINIMSIDIYICDDIKSLYPVVFAFEPSEN